MYVCILHPVVPGKVAYLMRIGNDTKGNMDGTITKIDKEELALVVKALTLAKDELVCDFHKNKIDELTSQFEAMLQEMTKISEKWLDTQDEGWYNRHDEMEGYHR
jgi:hypothetical protein